MATFLALAWIAWVLLQVTAFFAGPYVPGAGIVTNGLVTVFPKHLREMLTEAQQAAILAHEEGHAVHEHALKNMCRACFFVFRSEQLARVQEQEADDYAAARGHGPALASALRVLSTNYFDLKRAARLEAR